MKLSKFLLTISSVTLLSLLYVYQQTEILRLAYIGEKKMTVFQDLLDKNSILRYNIGKSASLVHVASMVSRDTDYEMPASYRLVRVVTGGGNLGSNTQVARRENLLSRLFGIRQQAEAKTINP